MVEEVFLGFDSVEIALDREGGEEREMRGTDEEGESEGRTGEGVEEEKRRGRTDEE